MLRSHTRISILLLGAALFLTACTASGELPDMETARQAQAAGDYDRAKEHYLALMEKGYPEASRAFVKMSKKSGVSLSNEEQAGVVSALSRNPMDKKSAEGFAVLGDLALAEKPVNTGKALGYYTQAFDAGHTQSGLKISDLYADLRQGHVALEWYKKVYNQTGDHKILYRMGRLYEKGDAVKQSYSTALSYYLWAKELGVTSASDAISRVSKKLPAKAVEETAKNLESFKTSVALSREAFYNTR